ncbi:hypothetical protein Tco_0944487 [Tanacetum coccineum]
MRQGWDPRYKIWVEHGEPAPPTPPPVIDNTRQPLMSDMTALLNDLSYIPPNNEHNEPTQGDIGETSNEPTQATRNEFEELYASANEELYPGCDYFFQNVFPISKGFKLPPSYYAIKKTFKMIGLGYESIHACEHDCCLFRGDNNKDLDFCPVCNTSRWKTNHAGRKFIEVLRYFSIIPDYNVCHKSSHTAKNMIWHATGKCTESGKMQHPVDDEHGRNLTPSLQHVAGDIDNIQSASVVMYEREFFYADVDCCFRLEVNMRAMVLWTINDFPARSSLSGWSGQGYKACLTCNEDTPYVRVLSKTAYVGHRRFLKKPHKWRRSLEFNGQTDNKDPPKEFGRDVILAQLDRLPTCRFQVFRSVCKPIGLRSFIRFDAQELKKVKWYVLHNSPEIDTYRSQFKSLFPNKDMQEEFPDWFGSQIRQRHVDNDQDPEVSTTSELFALANGPSWTPISVNSCVVDGVRYVVHSRDERRTTQNSGICSPGPDGEMYYGQLQEILEFKYLLFKVVLFRVKWFDTRNQGRKVKRLVLRNNMTQIDTRGEAFKDDQYILVTQVKQVFYLEDKAKPHWKVVEHVNHKKFSDGGVIVVEDDPDIIHFDNSSDLPLSTSLNDLDNATLHIDGQSTEVDAPPDIIDVVDQDDDITDDEDALPHDLADSDDEDLINVDDDGVDKMSADVARSHGGDGGGEDRPPPHHVPSGCMGCFANRGKGKRKPNLGGRGAGRLNTRDKTRNLSLKEIAVAKGPVPINFEQGDKQTLNPLGPHAAHWSNYIGEVVRSVPLYYPSWEKVPKERKAAIISEIGTLFDLRPHMDSSRWTEISEGINMHLQKAYNTNKASFKAKYWKADPTTGSYDLEAIRRARPEEITAAEWDKYIKFWNDPKNLARAAQNRLNRQKSVVTSRQGSRSLARLRDEMRQASDTQEYPSLIDTFWRTHTVDGVFPKDEDRRIYEEMKRLEATGEYTEDEINALARGGKLRGHIPGVGRVLPSRATSRPSMPAPDKSLKSMHRKVDFMMSLFRSDSKYSDMFKEFESGGASGSGGCGDDEEGGDDEDGDSDD